MPRSTRRLTRHPKHRRTLRFDDPAWDSILAESEEHAKAHGGQPSAARYLEHLHRKHVARKKAANGKEA